MNQEQSDKYIELIAIASTPSSPYDKEKDKQNCVVLRDHHYSVSTIFISSCFCNQNKINNFLDTVKDWFKKEPIEKPKSDDQEKI